MSTRTSRASDTGFVRVASFATRKKSEAMIIASHKALKTNRDIKIFHGDSVLKQQRHFKFLGVVVDESLSWNNAYVIYCLESLS